MSEDVKETGQEERSELQDKQPETESAAENAQSQQKLADLEGQCVQLKDQFLRKAAEFENYRRRTENEFLSLTKYAAENTILQMLPILDDFNRFLKSGKENGSDDPFYKGAELIYQKFLKALDGLGLKPMEVVGKEFNVDYHDALMQMARADVPPHTVIEEVERGYFLHDKVIRHAKVVVSAESTSED